jgi:hypothetical protein
MCNELEDVVLRRWHPDNGAKPAYQTYKVDINR